MESQVATAQPDVVVEDETDAETRLLSPWNVVVHDDPISLMSYVTLIFQKVFGYGRTRAEKHMMEVHTAGRSVLWTGARERAELYVQKLHAAHLRATLESADG